MPAAAPAPVALVTERRRVVIRLVNGDEIDVAEGTEQEETMEQARAVVRLLAEAEAAAEWPEIEGRFLRPSSIVSVDVLVAE